MITPPPKEMCPCGADLTEREPYDVCNRTEETCIGYQYMARHEYGKFEKKNG